MQTIQVKNGQSLYDVAVQHCGKVDAVSEIVKLNNLSFTPDLVEGQSLVLPDIQDLKVVKEFLIEGITPANDVSITPWDVVLITDTYEVLRTFEVNFSNILYCTGSTFNEFNTVNSFFALRDNTGVTSAIYITTYNSFEAADCSTMPDGSYIRSSSMMKSGMRAKSPDNSILALVNMPSNKFYQLYIIAGNETPNDAIKIKVNGQEITKVTSGNYPLAANGDMYVNPAVIRFKNVVPVLGDIVIEFVKMGTAWPVAINYLIIEETNERKP